MRMQSSPTSFCSNADVLHGGYVLLLSAGMLSRAPPTATTPPCFARPACCPVDLPRPQLNHNHTVAVVVVVGLEKLEIFSSLYLYHNCNAKRRNRNRNSITVLP